MPTLRTVRSPLVMSGVITVVLVLTSLAMTLVPPDANESGTDELPVLRSSGGELVVWVLGSVVLYVAVLASVMFVRWLGRPTKPGAA